MATILRRHGYKGLVEMDPTGNEITPVYEQVASLNGFTIDMTRDRVDVTAFGDTNKLYVQGLMDIKGTIKGFWEAVASRPLFDAAMGDTAVGLKLTPSTLDSTAFFSGLAYLDANIEVAADGAITVGGSFGAAGPWTLAPTTPLVMETGEAPPARRATR